SALSFMLNGLQKPVIFTGSQLPVGDLRTDAKENLITSLHFASLQKDGAPVISEVCIYFEYKLLRANRTTKINAENFDAFDSPDYPNLGESGIHLDVRKHALRTEDPTIPFRSEEHTSELQSRENLVCRLLLEKKKKTRLPLH